MILTKNFLGGEFVLNTVFLFNVITLKLTDLLYGQKFWDSQYRVLYIAGVGGTTRYGWNLEHREAGAAHGPGH